MSRMADRAGWRTAIAAIAASVMLLLATGCADEEPPGDSAPVLAERLDKVDAAIEEGDLGGAHKAVDDLVADTARAQVDGDITEEQADRILEAAQELLAELPEPEETEEPEPEEPAGAQ